MKLLDINELVRIITLAGTVLAQDLNVADRRLLGNSLKILGYVLTDFPFSESKEEDAESKKWLQATAINIEILKIQKQIDELEKKIETNAP